MNKGLIEIRKEKLTTVELERVKKSLTLKNPAFESKAKYSKYGAGKTPEFLTYYTEYIDTIVVPRNTLNTLSIRLSVDSFSEVGKSIDVKFLKDLRTYQKNFYYDQTNFEGDMDRIWEAGCGSGKTIMALRAFADVLRQTLVFVPSNYLAKQWKMRAEEFTDAVVCILSNKTLLSEMSGSDMLIVTFDMYNCLGKDKKEALQQHVGFVIVDEGHRMGADTYHPIIADLPARNRLCLTVTFRRPDGREALLSRHFGRVYKMKNPLPQAMTYFLRTGVEIKHLVSKGALKNYEKCIQVLEEGELAYQETAQYITWDFKNPMSRVVPNFAGEKALTESVAKIHQAQLDNYIVENPRRMKLYIALIKTLLDAGRVVLVLSKRKEVLYRLSEIFKNYKVAIIVSETNKMTEAERKKIEGEAQLVLGIMQLAQEGMDIDRLDTLILLHPIIDTEQAIGRICRVVKGKPAPLVFYPLDVCYSYNSIREKARKFIDLNSEFKGNISFRQVKEILS